MKRVTPIINELLAGWKLIPVAGQQDEACNALDKTCGIDYLLTNDEQVYGVSSKVQYGKNYRTFTLSKGAYEKRSEALSSGSVLPHFTMQGYVNGGEIIGLAIVETEDLLDFIERRLAEERGRFYVCNWDAMNAAGYDVREYNSVQEKGHNAAASFVRVEPQEDNPEKKLHEMWHEAYQRYLAEQDAEVAGTSSSKHKVAEDEENCAECAMREVCEGLSAILDKENK